MPDLSSPTPDGHLLTPPTRWTAKRWPIVILVCILILAILLSFAFQYGFFNDAFFHEYTPAEF